MTRIKSQEPYVLVQDDSCHWYIIPDRLQDKFYQWSSLDDDDLEDWDFQDFSEFAIGGSPTLVKVYEFEVK